MWRQLKPILVLPGTVTVLIPAVLMTLTGTLRPGWGLPSPWRSLVLGGGIATSVFGLSLLGACVLLFARHGHGTLAPWDPPVRLVVRGVYRRVRNPMISGVFFVLGAEAMVLGSWVLAGWFVFFVVGQMLYIRFEEEPRLAERFGETYLRYEAHVPRWIPTFWAWSQ